jgi:hypothetical protein
VNDSPTLRRIARGDAGGVYDVFMATLALGRPLPYRLDGDDWFAALSIGWYLDHGVDDSLVALDGDGAVVGYGLVCTQPIAHRRWLRRHTLATTARLAAMTLSGEIGGDSRRFYAARLRDALHLARSGWHGPHLGHAHVNLLAGYRSGSVARRIRDHVDERCRGAGLDGWVGEVNARVGHRSAALARVAGTVTGSAPNRTLSRLAGEPVHRLTIVRWLNEVSDPARRHADGRSLAGRSSGCEVADHAGDRHRIDERAEVIEVRQQVAAVPQGVGDRLGE